jgi:hypothetical protein
VTRLASFVCLVPIVFGLGCTRVVDPCLDGASLAGDQCVRDEVSRAGVDSGKSSQSVPAEDAGRETDVRDIDADDDDDDDDDNGGDQNDASDFEAVAPEADAELDAADTDAAGDGGPDLDGAPPPPIDAAPDAAPDAASDAGDAGIKLCTPEDLTRWQDFHLSTQLVPQIGACWQADAGCSVDSCPMLECMRQDLGVVSCNACGLEEAACIAASCMERCGASGENEACRACACNHGCVAAFETCSGSSLDACADCDETTCTNQSRLPPELILTVLRPLLL